MTKIRFLFLLFFSLVALGAGAYFAPAANAQSGDCPPSGNGVFIRPVGYINGSWPDGMLICGTHGSSLIDPEVQIVLQQGALCGQFLQINPNLEETTSSYVSSFHVFPEGLYMTNALRIHFWAWLDRVPSPWTYPNAPNQAFILVELFDEGGNRVYSRSLDMYSDSVAVQSMGNIFPWYPRFFTFDTGVISFDPLQPYTSMTNGYMRITPDILLNPVPYGDDYKLDIANVVAVPNTHDRPVICLLPGWDNPYDSLATPTPAPTLPPTWTPTGTWTPPTATNTPTPWATPPLNSTATIFPTPTATAIQFPVITAQPTATPYTIPTLAPFEGPGTIPVPTLAAIQWPTLEIPTLAPLTTPNPLIVTVQNEYGATIEAQSTSMWEWAEGSVDIATRWAEPLAWTEDLFSVWEETEGGAGFYTVELTNTDTISTPVQSAQVAVSRAVYPVRFLKTLQLYAPATWPLVSVVFISAILMLFTLFTKFGIAIVTTVIEVIRRVWEAIPLN